MSDQDEGLPLADAVRTYCDPELWAAYERARAKLHSIPPRPPWLGSSRRERGAWSDRYERALPAARAALDAAVRDLSAAFKPHLRRGDLVATGTKGVVTDGSKPTVIQAHLWDALELELDRGSVRAGNLVFAGVWVLPASAPRLDGPSFPGRPSVMSAVEQEMRRRAERGELRPKLARECLALAAWAKEAHPGCQTPTAKTIENGLRSVYWQLRARETP